MLISDERILTTHTGSLPRPRGLVELYVDRAGGRPVDDERLTDAGRAALEHVIQGQIRAGIDVGNNGEQQREAFFLYVRNRMSGFGGHWDRKPWADVERYPEFKEARQRENAARISVSNRDQIPKAIGPVHYLDHAAIHQECSDFRAALDRAKNPFAEPFMTAPSPGIVAASFLNEHYPDQESYLQALGTALRIEYEAIVESGFLLQIDAPDLALERHVSFQDHTTDEFLGFVDLVVRTINAALVNIPRDRVRMHVCWGNYEGPHDCDIDLREILPVIRRMNVGALVLPFANPRHAHEYRVLRDIKLDDDQVIVAGVIDTLTNFVEHPEVVADRIERVAEAVGDPKRVLAGTDCGFDTAAGMGRVAEDVVWAKLAALSEGARIASRRLF